MSRPDSDPSFPTQLTRRAGLRRMAGIGLGAGLAVWVDPRHARGQQEQAPNRSPNERLHVAIVGTAHRAEANLSEIAGLGESIVALCDVDDRLLGRAASRFPKAKTYNDFRKLLEQKDIDAVVVSTADHVHVPASAAAMHLGKHVYCEKPLSHSVHEARFAAELAAKMKVATQLGTQIHATDNYRRVVEWIRGGVIGPVKAAHVWCGKTWSGGERPKETPPVPKTFHWDLWLGPAPERPYHPTYHPANWRRWWDFGNGTLGDMACHLMDLPFWALDLRHPTTVSAEGPPVHPETTPPWQIVTYEFPARGDNPPVTLTWSDGGKQPDAVLAEAKLPKWETGILFVGEKGYLLADYDRRVLSPDSAFKDFQPPAPSIARSMGHHAEWIQACKTGSPTTCNFDYSGALTEAVLLGNVAYRTGTKLQWDAAALKATNCPEAERFLRREYRQGWTL